jgi:hypothetical protein
VSPLSSDDNLVHLQLEGFYDTLERTTGSAFNVFLSKVFSAAFNQSTDTATAVDAAVCKTYLLKNSGDYFAKVCRSNAAREWLERAIRRRKDVFLVVGIRTLTDAEIAQRNNFSRSIKGSFDVPVSRATTMAFSAGATMMIPSKIPSDAKVELSQRNQYKTTAGFIAPGEQIYAIQYRKIELSWFSRRNLDKASLEDGNRWKVYVGKRGMVGDWQDDNVCARLQGNPPIFDFDSECESFVFGDSEEEMVILK